MKIALFSIIRHQQLLQECKQSKQVSEGALKSNSFIRKTALTDDGSIKFGPCLTRVFEDLLFQEGEVR